MWSLFGSIGTGAYSSSVRYNRNDTYLGFPDYSVNNGWHYDSHFVGGTLHGFEIKIFP